jgi:hypothetical protein
MTSELANTELTPADVLAVGESWTRIEPFALTFDGFRYWGSVEKCAEVAGQTPGTLTDLRTCLFFEARRWNCLGREPDAASMKRICALITVIQQKIKAGDMH